MQPDPLRPEPDGQSRRLFLPRSGGLTQARVRRILELAGYRTTRRRPGPGDFIAISGHDPNSGRSTEHARASEATPVWIDEAWLRAPLQQGTGHAPPMGLLIDTKALHHDPTRPSQLETLLTTDPLDDTALLDRARGAIARMVEAGLGSDTGQDPNAALPSPGYVLVLDQEPGDASVLSSGADGNRFREMLYWAQENHPGSRILIRPPPSMAAGAGPGHFGPGDVSDRMRLLDQRLPFWPLFEGAQAVYTVSDQAGFEAIFAGHRPHVFGQPFYAGWALTEDAFPVQRRQRRLTRAQLFAGAMLLYPTWYDPLRDRLCRYEDAAESLATEIRAQTEDARGWVTSDLRQWHRPVLERMFGGARRVQFEDVAEKARQSDRRWMVPTGYARPRPEPQGVHRVAEGFLEAVGPWKMPRSPMSLTLDDLGSYDDPQRPSRLERMIAARADLRPDQQHRARALIRALTEAAPDRQAGIAPERLDLPQGHRILVAGFVEQAGEPAPGASLSARPVHGQADSASLRAALPLHGNLALLAAVRAARPTAMILYMPPRNAASGQPTARYTDLLSPGTLADAILPDTYSACLLSQVQEVWTQTSLLGFAALLRELPVTTLGAPFYAGWGLTTDLGDVPPRRRARITREGLVHACLIDYPRYIDPVTQRPCPVEVVVERLKTGMVRPPGRVQRSLSDLRDFLMRYALFRIG